MEPVKSPLAHPGLDFAWEDNVPMDIKEELEHSLEDPLVVEPSASGERLAARRGRHEDPVDDDGMELVRHNCSPFQVDFRCVDCGEVCEDSEQISLHRHRQHPDRPHQCSRCRVSLTLQDYYFHQLGFVRVRRPALPQDENPIAPSQSKAVAASSHSKAAKPTSMLEIAEASSHPKAAVASSRQSKVVEAPSLPKLFVSSSQSEAVVASPNQPKFIVVSSNQSKVDVASSSPSKVVMSPSLTKIMAFRLFKAARAPSMLETAEAPSPSKAIVATSSPSKVLVVSSPSKGTLASSSQSKAVVVSSPSKSALAPWQSKTVVVSSLTKSIMASSQSKPVVSSSKSKGIVASTSQSKAIVASTSQSKVVVASSQSKAAKAPSQSKVVVASSQFKAAKTPSPMETAEDLSPSKAAEATSALARLSTERRQVKALLPSEADAGSGKKNTPDATNVPASAQALRTKPKISKRSDGSTTVRSNPADEPAKTVLARNPPRVNLLPDDAISTITNATESSGEAETSHERLRTQVCKLPDGRTKVVVLKPGQRLARTPDGTLCIVKAAPGSVSAVKAASKQDEARQSISAVQPDARINPETQS